MSLFNLGSNGQLITHVTKVEGTGAEAEKLKGEAQKKQAELAEKLLPFEQSARIRGEITGWTKYAKIIGVVLIGVLIFFGGLASISAIWEFIAPYWWAYLIGLVVILLIWR